MTEMARDLLIDKGTEKGTEILSPTEGEHMTRINLEKRDQMAYHALYYAIHGDVDRSEKIRTMLRQNRERQERVPTREFA